MPVDRPAGLQIRGAACALLDEPFGLRVRGAGPDAPLQWRARYRDDDGRVWRASAARAEALGTAWVPAKPGTGPLAALQSLRPVEIEVRAEASDGRAASRGLSRRLMGDGVRMRRWREGAAATLHLPAQAPCATLLIDATAGPHQAAVAVLAAALLASRGVLVLCVTDVGGRATRADGLATARERLAAVPAASQDIRTMPALDPIAAIAQGDTAGVVLPPGVGAREADGGSAARRAEAWDRLLHRLGARPRAQPAPSG